ncbi:MAG: DUF6576 domain-containing protein [Planctomycetota bacterium]
MSFRSGLLGRVFGEGENPLGWSVPAGRLGGLVLRLHLVLLIWSVLRLVRSIPHDARGWPFELWWLGSVALVLLFRELAVWALVTRGDDRASPVVLWPLGNAVPPSPDASPGRCIGQGAVGLSASVLLLLCLGGALYAMTGRWDAVVFWPVERVGLEREMYADGILLGGLWTLYAVNSAVLLFHLLPMLPLDGGRVLQGALGTRSDEGSETPAALGHAVGMLTAVVLAAVGWLTETTPVIAVAAAGFFVCWQEQRRSRLLAPEDWTEPSEADDEEASFMPLESASADVIGSGEQTAEPEEDAIDAILAKISRSGIESLTEDERTALDAASGPKPGTEHGDR